MFYFLLSAIFAIGIVLWVVTSLINKSNNKGDSSAEFDDFSVGGLVVLDKEDNRVSQIPLR